MRIEPLGSGREREDKRKLQLRNGYHGSMNHLNKEALTLGNKPEKRAVERKIQWENQVKKLETRGE